jgi:hypothetical protein
MTFRPRASASDLAYACGVRRRLLRRHRVHRLTVPGHRMRSADVCAWRHHRHISGEREDESGGGGASAGGSDKDHNRCARANHPADDVACGLEQSAGGPQHDDDDVRAGGVALVDDAGEVFG